VAILSQNQALAIGLAIAPGFRYNTGVDMHTILKVLVGSQAHGLEAADSDTDFRAVFVIPTADLFRLGFRYESTRLQEGLDDETAWEVGRFLSLAMQCHPLILETLLAPVAAMDDWGAELRGLFPAVWSARRAYDAFLGYAANQRKKFLDKKDGRPAKYAAAYVRVVYNLCELLESGSFTVRIAETPIGDTISRIKHGQLRAGAVIDLGEGWTEEATKRLGRCTHEADLEQVNGFLIRLRKAFLV
jgi:hypothetical protein